jgi:hypothetical protein
MAELSHTDSESEDHNKDPLEDDREVLREEEEREKLLTTSESFKDGHREEGARKERRRSRRRKRKERKKPATDHEGRALYKMEEGSRDSSSQLSSRSSTESLNGRETALSRTRVCPLYSRSSRTLMVCSDCESKSFISLSSPSQ